MRFGRGVQLSPRSTIRKFMIKEIVIKLDENKQVALKFVLENDEWVCRASDEFINDLKSLLEISL
jgi:hypothetical protein